MHEDKEARDHGHQGDGDQDTEVPPESQVTDRGQTGARQGREAGTLGCFQAGNTHSAAPLEHRLTGS